MPTIRPAAQVLYLMEAIDEADIQNENRLSTEPGLSKSRCCT